MKVSNPFSSLLIPLGCFFPFSFPTSSSSLLGLAAADVGGPEVQIHKLDSNNGKSNGITKLTRTGNGRMLVQSIGNKELANTADNTNKQAAATAENPQPRFRRTTRNYSYNGRTSEYSEDYSFSGKYPTMPSYRQPPKFTPPRYYVRKRDGDHRTTPRYPHPHRRPAPKPVHQPRTPKLVHYRPAPARRPYRKPVYYRYNGRKSGYSDDYSFSGKYPTKPSYRQPSKFTPPRYYVRKRDGDHRTTQRHPHPRRRPAPKPVCQPRTPKLVHYRPAPARRPYRKPVHPRRPTPKRYRKPVYPRRPTPKHARKPSPSEQPTTPTSEQPTTLPSEEPTTPPSEEPTTPPSEEPTTPPSEEPTTPPSEEPTGSPTRRPTRR